MLIVFEGPDKTGKSTAAAELSYSKIPTYNMTLENYKRHLHILKDEPTITHCYDRIDWFTHMVYRLALPGYEWNDERPRTVFAAPEAHLVFKLHKPGTLTVKDELYEDEQLAAVNDMYYHMLSWLSDLNADLGFTLFKTVSLMQVDRSGDYSQQMLFCHSPNKLYLPEEVEHITTNEALHKFLQQENHRIIAAGK